MARREDQPQWQDPASGYLRRNVSPPGVPQPMQIVEVHFPPGGRVAFEPAAREIRIHQQVWVLEGAIDITLGEELPPIARRRLPGHATRPSDDVPQPHAQARTLRRGDRLRTPREETMMAPAWSLRRLHALD